MTEDAGMKEIIAVTILYAALSAVSVFTLMVIFVRCGKIDNLDESSKLVRLMKWKMK